MLISNVHKSIDVMNSIRTRLSRNAGCTSCFKLDIACEQAHLVCYSREYLGGGSPAGEKNGSRKSHRLDFHRQDTCANNTLSEPARRLVAH